MTCQHELPPGCCKLCAADRKEQQQPGHVDGDGLITSVAPAGAARWHCKVFIISSACIVDDFFTGTRDEAIGYAESMAQSELEAVDCEPRGKVTATYFGPADPNAFVKWANQEEADWADWRVRNQPPSAVQ